MVESHWRQMVSSTVPCDVMVGLPAFAVCAKSSRKSEALSRGIVLVVQPSLLVIGLLHASQSRTPLTSMRPIYQRSKRARLASRSRRMDRGKGRERVF